MSNSAEPLPKRESFPRTAFRRVTRPLWRCEQNTVTRLWMLEKGAWAFPTSERNFPAAPTPAEPAAHTFSLGHRRISLIFTHMPSTRSEWRSGERVGLITQRSVDRNHAPLSFDLPPQKHEFHAMHSKKPRPRLSFLQKGMPDPSLSGLVWARKVTGLLPPLHVLSAHPPGGNV